MLLNAFRQHSTKLAFATAGVLLAAGQRQYNATTRVARCESNPEAHPALKEVELKNGSKISQAIVGASMLSLSMLIDSNPLAFYELVQKCKNEDHKLWVGTEPVLKKIGLLDDNGRTHRSVCDVLLSAAFVEGLDVALGSPYKPKLKS